MSCPRPFEEEVIWSAEEFLRGAVNRSRLYSAEARLRILECASADLGGFDRRVFGNDFGTPIVKAGAMLAAELRRLSVHPALALASLARPSVSREYCRLQGAYYTDFRLAQFLADQLHIPQGRAFHVLDPACGSGTLLVAAVIALSRGDGKLRDRLLRESVCGADLSSYATRSAIMALASLTSDEETVRSIRSRIRQTDSLLRGVEEWSDVTKDGFDVVIGNPPWEKLKLTRHEWLRLNGVNRHYGETSRFEDDEKFQSQQTSLKSYVSRLSERFNFQGRGEHDLYKLFLELCLAVSRPEAQIALLLPAGFIRSQGTEQLRAAVFDACSTVSLTVLDNRPRFFSIDSRFKFLSFHGIVANGHKPQPIQLAHLSADKNVLRMSKSVAIARDELQKIRRDWSVPEVRTNDEWRVFRDLAKKGYRMSDSNTPWFSEIVREVDMTQGRPFFLRRQIKDALPLIEGRMVHQYRFSAKKYISGSGRKSLWVPNDRDSLRSLRPQFYFPLSKMASHIQARSRVLRAGFCDITGQTNERSMLASRIPPNVVCGNKVPTVLFKHARNQRPFIDCWLAIVNSIPFDWLLRRVITTTVNFFLLVETPLAPLGPDSRDGRLLARLSAMLSDDQNLSAWRKAAIRAEIDWRVLAAFGHDVRTMELMLKDFPLLDRTQPSLPGEDRSTVTHDFLLLRTGESLGAPKSKIEYWNSRMEEAKRLGAVPYVPSQLALTTA